MHSICGYKFKLFCSFKVLPNYDVNMVIHSDLLAILYSYIIHTYVIRFAKGSYIGCTCTCIQFLNLKMCNSGYACLQLLNLASQDFTVILLSHMREEFPYCIEGKFGGGKVGKFGESYASMICQTKTIQTSAY